MATHAVTWVLVADGHRARVFVNEGPGTGLKPALDQEFIHMLPPDRDMAADKAGSARSGGGSHHTLDHHEDLHRHEKAVFARELAQRMDGYLKDASGAWWWWRRRRPWANCAPISARRWPPRSTANWPRTSRTPPCRICARIWKT